ncbi:DUF1566 domain-containing protein [Ralstonia sp. TCR112]|uniref:DUF1566 domain-containing protein n=1 Tax=Ralstonia sp. TCR112 TaxID=2601730 RepID=UPI0011BE2F78|nr:DUF1566 domain-containing protein [Ralstonia sp. TCR112]TXD58898.1 DUF1566 domain-containing protein [Ralstonia sp. TCR112]
MNAVVNGITVPAIIGTPWEGGFYSGLITFGGDVYAQVTAAKTDGEHKPAIWLLDYTEIKGADSFFDGLANTKGMAEAGSEIAQWALEQRIAGFDDWAIPARDQLELQYRHFKPTTQENWVCRNGDNPSSLPPGYPYTIHLPGQTTVELFRVGGTEAFAADWYWSSTQYSADDAWSQTFNGGSQHYASKDLEGRVRLVRSIKL